MLKLVLAAIVLVGLAFAGIAVRMFFIRGGEFRKSCSSRNPETGERMDCSCGGDTSSCNNS